MNRDTVQINEILCVFKKYYDRYPSSAPVLDRRDAALYVQRLVDREEELEAREELMADLEELEKENDELSKKVSSLENEIEDLQAELTG